ncbi:MAG: fenitrothion hydrolase [Solirubrobacteraceae bacterium]|nr:fenitrothion hydrolase [Solirubrobacteraceae bacterium]
MLRLPRSRTLAALTGLASLLALTFGVGVADAHGLVGRRDLPVPTWLFAWAASAVLIASFVGLGALWREPRLGRANERRLFRVPRWLEVPFGILGVALLVLTIVAGLRGVQIDTANFAPTSLFVALWLGVPFLSLLVGDLYAVLNPIRAVGRATGWVAGRIAGDRLPEALAWPERLGRWPAAVGLALFAWVELCFPGRGDPSQLAVLILLFCLVHGVGMSLYGTEAWVRNADPFAAWFGWVARLAPLRWDGGTAYLRAPGVGAAKERPVAGDAAIVIVAIGTTTWDGLSGGELMGTTVADLANDITGGFLSATWANAVVNTIFMLLAIGVVTALIFAGARGMISQRARDAAAKAREDGRAQGGPPATATLVREFAPSLVPIAVAYAVGHYLSLLAFQGQAILPLLSNPYGTLAEGDGGWLGAAGWTIDYTWLSSNAIWYLQVAALVTGHVMSLTLSHDRALERFPRKRAARSQRAMLVVAVLFTCNGLWLLSSV